MLCGAGVIAAALLGAAAPARAHFERMLLSSRAAALGGAFVAIADDPSATVENPAGLCGIRSLSLLSTYQRPYGLDGVDEGYLAAALPVPGVALGASWFHRGVDGIMNEDVLTVAVGRDLKRTSEDASLSIGASVDLAMVSVAESLDESARAASFAAGVLLRPFAFIGVGYAIRNLNAPEFDLVEGGGATTLASTQAVALAYYWQERLVVTVESRQDGSDEWRARGGFELRVESHLVLRGGLDESRASAGAGVEWHGVTLDAAMTSHEVLGASYLFTLRYTRAPEVKP